MFDFQLGELPFIGRNFYPFILPIENAFPEDVYFLYYAGKGRSPELLSTKLTKYKSKTL